MTKKEPEPKSIPKDFEKGYWKWVISEDRKERSKKLKEAIFKKIKKKKPSTKGL